MIPAKINLQVLFVTLIAASQVLADTKIKEVKDWSLWETSSGSEVTCYLQNINKVIFRAEDYFLEIHKAKNKVNSPVEVLMRIEKNKKASTGLLLTTNTGAEISFSDMNDQKAIFWGVPKNLTALIQQLTSAQEEITVVAKGGKKDVDFSYNGTGFKEVLSEMERRCNASLPLIQTAFETNFLKGVANHIELSHLNSGKVTQLRSIYFNAYSVFSQLTDTQNQLAQVLEKYQPLVDELQANQATLNQIINKDLPQSKKTLADAQKQQIDLKNEIAKLTQQIPGLIAQVTASQKAYDQVYAILAPLEPEFNRLSANISDSQRSLAEAQARLNDLDNRMQQIAQQINQLSIEANRIEQILPQKRNELDRAISILRNAEFQRAQFNVSAEREKRLRSNGEYNHLMAERPVVQSNLSQVQVEINQLQNERSRTLAELNQCRTVPNNDCTGLEQALARADQMIAEKENQQRDLSNRLNQLNSSISNIENQVDLEVRREYDRLVTQENQARNEMNRIQDDVNRDQTRLSQIRNSDLPRLESERSQLSFERPNVVARIGAALADINKYSRELADFKVANNWDKKLADVESKQRQLTLDQNNLATAQSRKLNAERALQKAINTEAEMKKLIDQLNVQVITLNQRNLELEEGLKELPAERAPYDDKIAELQNQMATNENEFLNLLK